MMKKTAISIMNVHKEFVLPHEKATGLKQAVINFRPGRQAETLKVLKGISFDIHDGEFFGIVGRNGSGKSTLLKMIAQIYTPTSGSVTVNGQLTPFIELGVGFNPELTGRENVYLNGALFGMDHKQVDAIYDEVVDFAELRKFMDQRLKNYSSGMQVRLAFSIAIQAKSDILLVDEVLAVGDAAFQQKCFNYFDRLKRERRTIVFVSHDMGSVKQFCDRAVLIDKGEIRMIGDTNKIAREYERLNYNETVENAAKKTEIVDNGFKLRALDSNGNASSSYEYGQKINLELSWPAGTPVGIAGIVLWRGSEVVFATNSLGQSLDNSKNKATLIIDAKLGNGRYHLSGGLFGRNRHDSLGTVDGPEILIYDQPIKGEHDDEWEGLTYLNNTWR